MTVNRRSGTTVVAALAIVASSGCSLLHRDVAPANGGEVREYLGASARRNAELEHIDAAPGVVWRAPAGRGSAGAVALGERVTAVTTVDRRVVALDTRTGKLLWQWRGGHTFSAGPVMGGGMVFTASEGGGGTLTGLSMSSGRRRWYHRVGDVGAPLVLRHGRVYGATTSGFAFAYEQESGRRAWMYRVGPTRSGPLVVRDRVIIVTMTDSMLVLEAATGRVESRSQLPGTTVAPLAAIDDSTLALATPTGAVLAVAIPSGTVRWQVAASSPIFGAPVVARDSVYALTNDCTLWTIPVMQPEMARAVSLGCVTKAAPAVVRDGVLVATVSGTLALYDRSDGRLRWADTLRSEIRHPPMVLNGQIVVAQTLGDVVSYR